MAGLGVEVDATVPAPWTSFVLLLSLDLVKWQDEGDAYSRRGHCSDQVLAVPVARGGLYL